MKMLKAGIRLKSAVCDAEVMVIKIAAGEYELCCGGVEMAAIGSTCEPGTQPLPGLDNGCLIGKRYVDAAEKVELLCTKGGRGTLALGGEVLVVKQAKALPSSD